MPKTDRKTIIAVDVDDVIGNENEAVRQFTNDQYGTSYTSEDFLVDGEYWGYWEKIWGVNEQEARRRMEDYLASPIKDDLKLIDGAAHAIRKLKESHNLVIVTSRYGRQLTTTGPWLEKHFPETFGQVAFVATWSKDKKVSKAAICKEIGADYLIDDNAEHCNLAAESGVKALLFGDYGWNRKAKLNPGVTKVKDWQSVMEYFDEQS